MQQRHWVSKKQASCAGARCRGNHRQSNSKAKSKNGICAGFWFDRREHKAKRSHGRFKQTNINTKNYWKWKKEIVREVALGG